MLKHKEEILKKFFSGEHKEIEKLDTIEDSMRLGQFFIELGLLIPLERHLHSENEAKKKYPKHLVPSRMGMRKMTDKGFYSWNTPKPFKKLVILLTLGIIIAIAFMLFSIWPLWLKIAIWYFSFYTLIVLVIKHSHLCYVGWFYSVKTSCLALPFPFRFRLLDPS